MLKTSLPPLDQKGSMPVKSNTFKYCFFFAQILAFILNAVTMLQLRMLLF
jgi:hypothetical protein